MQLPSTFFGWVGFLLEQYGPLFLRGAGMTHAHRHQRHHRWASCIGLLVAHCRARSNWRPARAAVESGR